MTHDRRRAPGTRSPHRRGEAPTASPPPRQRAASAVGLALLLVALVYATVHMNTLSDTWVSLAGGRQIAAHGIDDADPFSFNSRPSARESLPAGASRWQRLRAWAYPTGWINQNWLSHLVLYGIHAAGGDGALLAWKLLLYAWIAGVLLLSAGIRGAPLPVAAASAAAALAASREFLEVRAQDHTNLMAAVAMLVLGLAARRDRRWLWSLPALLALWANLHGGFVFGLAVAGVFLAGGALASRRPGRFLQHPPGTLVTGAAALAAAGGAAVVLSPYRLANLVHPIEISLGRDAALWRTVVEWRPLWRDPGPGALPFIGLAAVTVLALGGATRAALRRRTGGTRSAATRAPAAQEWALLDLGDVAAVLLALAMAAASRRFVPLAAVIVAAPLATWLDEALASWRARAPAADAVLRRHAAVLVGTAVAAAAVWLGARCLRTYAGPWPVDFTHTSPLDRLAWTHLRPGGVCRFLDENRVTGRVWNYWEEGGYLAWAQAPGAATGRLPVLVFIDGRAQGAYPADALRAYYLLRGGGPAGQEARDQRRQVTGPELERAREWTRRQLDAGGVWLADVPYAQQDLPLSLVLLNLAAWEVVYADEEHTLLVNADNPNGRSLVLGVDTGATRFPDAFSAALTRLRRAVGAGGAPDAGRLVTLARAVFAIRPSPRAVRLVVSAAARERDRGVLTPFLREVVADLLANRERYRGQNGYAKRLLAAEAALETLVGYTRSEAGSGSAAVLAEQLADVASDRERTVALALW